MYAVYVRKKWVRGNHDEYKEKHVKLMWLKCYMYFQLSFRQDRNTTKSSVVNFLHSYFIELVTFGKKKIKKDESKS